MAVNVHTPATVAALVAEARAAAEAVGIALTIRAVDVRGSEVCVTAQYPGVNLDEDDKIDAATWARIDAVEAVFVGKGGLDAQGGNACDVTHYVTI